MEIDICTKIMKMFLNSKILVPSENNLKYLMSQTLTSNNNLLLHDKYIYFIGLIKTKKNKKVYSM